MRLFGRKQPPRRRSTSPTTRCLGTTADGANPFSAKVNKALWTAKTVAEGGDGDLFYTMNKEAAGNDLGFLLQTAFVTKALVGLFGSDIFRIAMSPDGSAFNDAVRADTDTGLVTLPSNPKFSAFLNFGQTIRQEAGGTSCLTTPGTTISSPPRSPTTS
jgi:hypothetical protein